LRELKKEYKEKTGVEFGSKPEANKKGEGAAT
jgi:hypothetical protein